MGDSSLQASFPRCLQCNAQERANTRNLVVCIDGTSNQLGQNNTNVVKLFAKLDLETICPEQYACYFSGIGTRPKPLRMLDRMKAEVSDVIDMAFASNIEENVKEAYGWLARTYQKGDQIYLFGFSRGAYQVRLLAGMIHEVGLIRTPMEKQIATVYNHYDAIRSEMPTARSIAREFKNMFSWQDLRVHFVGVWDTVSSVGLVRRDVFLPSAADGCHFRHALALDELRVKFMPEYAHEMNSQTNDRKPEYILDIECTATCAGEHHKSTGSNDDPGLPARKCTKTTDIKEVWFAGTHSDVGGMNRPGKSHQAGHVSLLWMRREAAACGLMLLPTDMVWVPDDLDSGISTSMSLAWRAIEYIPIKQQISFTGSCGDALRFHRLQPRRIIPGQKVHASILFANAYRPLATLGEGFDIPTIHGGIDDTELDSQIWETGLFDDTAARELVTYLDGQQEVAPIYLGRLLFMLRFKEGKQCIRKAHRWQERFMKLIRNHECAPLVRLLSMVAYYEAACDPDAHPTSPTLPHLELSQNIDIFDDAKNCLSSILTAQGHPDGPRVVALFRPLTKHEILRERILTQDVLENIVELLDAMVVQQAAECFVQAMDGLTCLLQCEGTRQTIIEKLGANSSHSDVPRLSQILQVTDSYFLTTALRMVLTLARIPQESARSVCTLVKPRIRELAREDEGLVGLLAIETLLALYEPDDPNTAHDPRMRAKLASALIRLNSMGHDATDGQGRDVDPGRHILRRLYGLDATALVDHQRTLLVGLAKAVEKGNPRERVAATRTLLKLCESDIIRAYLCEVHLLDVFCHQLRRKDSALLAAYALTTCLNYGDMKVLIMHKAKLPKRIVRMLRLDYFDDAVGPVKGFEIFAKFMKHDDLREEIKNYNITEILNTKLGNGKANEIRTSLICLDIFRSYEQDGLYTSELVSKGLNNLRSSAWESQKVGVTLLSALAQTAYGVEAIAPRIKEILEMLLPESYLPVQPIAPGTISPCAGQTQATATIIESPEPRLRTLSNVPSPSRMLGPACVLRILAQKKVLRDRTRETIEYGNLKSLYLSGMLIKEADTSSWHLRRPNRTDVMDMLDKMINALDEERPEEGLMWDAALPNI